MDKRNNFYNPIFLPSTLPSPLKIIDLEAKVTKRVEQKWKNKIHFSLVHYSVSLLFSQ
jgi:hypothetical protein